MDDEALTQDTVVDPTIRVPTLPRRLLSMGVDGALMLAGATGFATVFGRSPPLGELFEPDAWTRWAEAGGAIPFLIGAAAITLILQGALSLSPGKLLCGLELVGTRNGAPIDGRRRWIRAVLALVTTALAGFGAAWVVVSPRQRTFYDLTSGTAVAVRPRASDR